MNKKNKDILKLILDVKFLNPKLAEILDIIKNQLDVKNLKEIDVGDLEIVKVMDSICKYYKDRMSSADDFVLSEITSIVLGSLIPHNNCDLIRLYLNGIGMDNFKVDVERLLFKDDEIFTKQYLNSKLFYKQLIDGSFYSNSKDHVLVSAVLLESNDIVSFLLEVAGLKLNENYLKIAVIVCNIDLVLDTIKDMKKEKIDLKELFYNSLISASILYDAGFEVSGNDEKCINTLLGLNKNSLNSYDESRELFLNFKECSSAAKKYAIKILDNLTLPYKESKLLSDEIGVGSSGKRVKL